LRAPPHPPVDLGVHRVGVRDERHVVMPARSGAPTRSLQRGRSGALAAQARKRRQQQIPGGRVATERAPRTAAAACDPAPETPPSVRGACARVQRGGRSPRDERVEELAGLPGFHARARLEEDLRVRVRTVPARRGAARGARRGVYVARCGFYVARRGVYVARCGVYVARRGVYVARRGVYVARRGVYVARRGVYVARRGVYVAKPRRGNPSQGTRSRTLRRASRRGMSRGADA
jgi:hypothetical protein